jgi:hypothetical protein
MSSVGPRPSSLANNNNNNFNNISGSSSTTATTMYNNVPAQNNSFVSVPQTSNIHDRASLEDRVREVAGKDVSLASILVHSPFKERDPVKLRDALVKEFNKNVPETSSCIENASARAGVRVDPGYFFVAAKNRVCEIRAGRGERLNLKISVGYTDVEFGAPDTGHGEGVVSQISPLIGKYSTWIVNVPQGKFARIQIGQQPLLLDEGSFVFHDPLFKCDPQTFLVDQASPHIAHGVLNILRVAPASFAKVIVNSLPILLPSRVDPYVFNTPLFRNDGVVAENADYISHPPIHVVRVRAGQVARVWQGSKAILLEYRDQPYYFEDPAFRVDSNQLFADANSKVVRHGQLIRLRPGVTGDLESAVVNCDGETRFVDRFTVIDSIHENLVGFVDLSLRTFVFPSRGVREERRRSDPSASPDEINFESMQTRDSLKIGVKLLVAVQVEDPATTLSRLKLSDIESHIENLAVSDMCRTVQQSSSQNFVNAMQSTNRQDENGANIPGTREETISDKVKGELERHLKDCGIVLKRFSIEEIKILDSAIQKEMAKQSLVAATANAEQAVLAQKAAIARSQAEVEAMSKRVRQEQENQLKVTAAQADLDAARLRAQAMIVEAEARAKSSELEAAMLQKYPELLQIRLAQLQFGAIQKANLTVVSADLAHSPYALGAQGLWPSPSFTTALNNNNNNANGTE